MEVPRHWRLKKQRYALVGEVCPQCQAKIFPPKEVCPGCGGGGTLIKLQQGIVYKASVSQPQPQDALVQS